MCVFALACLCAPRAHGSAARSACADGKDDEARTEDDDDWEDVASADHGERNDHRNDRADAVVDSVSIGRLFPGGEHGRANGERKTDEQHITPRVEEPAGLSYASCR